METNKQQGYLLQTDRAIAFAPQLLARAGGMVNPIIMFFSSSLIIMQNLLAAFAACVTMWVYVGG